MKTFLAASAFFVVTLALSALIYHVSSTSATAAFSAESVRVDREAASDGHLAWATAGEEA